MSYSDSKTYDKKKILINAFVSNTSGSFGGYHV